METKKCSECGRELPISEFNKKRRSRDGLQDRCRECFSRYNKERYASTRENTREAVRRYRSENPENVLATRLRMCEKNPTRKNSYHAVEEALRCGILTKPHTCSGCGCPDTEHRIEAHHHDYSKPLDVIWLCTPCHSRMDAQRRIREANKSRSDAS